MCVVEFMSGEGREPKRNADGTTTGGPNRETLEYELPYTKAPTSILTVRWQTTLKFEVNAQPRDLDFRCIVPGGDDHEETVQIRNSGGGGIPKTLEGTKPIKLKGKKPKSIRTLKVVGPFIYIPRPTMKKKPEKK